MAVISEERPSPIAGLWYEGNPKQLTLQIEDYLAAAEVPEIAGDMVGLVVPHAGHLYSGPTAAFAYRTVQELSFDVVAVISPLHKYFPAPVLTSAHRYYHTPLGSVPLDQDGLEQLSACLGEEEPLKLTPIANDDEHAIEIQLPFLQRALEGPFQLMPVMVRRRDLRMAQVLGKALAKVLSGRKALLVASSDLSHFYPGQIANRLDAEMLHQIKSFSPEGVMRAEEDGTGYACGATAIAAVLYAAGQLGASDVRVLHYSTSAEQTGDFSSVVGYGAAAIYRRN